MYDKIFPPTDVDKYSQFTIYNDIRVLFELLAGYKKSNNLTASQFAKLSNYPEMKTETFKKPEYTMLYHRCRKRLTKNEMSLEGFSFALEHVARELYPDVESSLERLKLLVNKAISHATN